MVTKDFMNWNLGVAKAYLNGDIDSAGPFATKALDLAMTLRDTAAMIEAHTSLGQSCQKREDLAEGLDHFNKAYEIAIASKRELGIGRTLMCIGNVYFQVFENQEAINTYSEALSLLLKVKSYEDASVCYVYLGVLQAREKRYTKALGDLDAAKQIYEEGHPVNAGMLYTNFGNIYSRAMQFDSAFRYYRLAIGEWERRQNRKQFATANFLLGMLYAKLGQNDSAQKYVKIYRKILGNDVKTDITAIHYYEISANLFEEMGMKDSAIYYLHQLADVHTKIIRGENRLLAKRQAVKMLKEKMLLENQKLRSENEIRTGSNKMLRTYLILLAVTLAIIVVILLFFFREYRKRQLLLAKMKKLSRTIAAQRNKLSAYNKQLNSNNQTLEEKVKQRTSELEDKNSKLREYANFNSHQLRRHISNIKGLSDLMNNGMANEQEVLPMIRSEIEKLDAIVFELNNKTD